MNLTLFADTKISILWYIIIVGAAILALIIMALYVTYSYHFGKPLAPLFHTRIKRWKDGNLALLEKISLTNDLTFEETRQEAGGYSKPQAIRTYRKALTRHQKIGVGVLTILMMSVTTAAVQKITGTFTGTITGVLVSLIWAIIPMIAYLKQPIITETINDGKKNKIIVPLSKYNINSVPVIPVMDLHPPLHKDIESGLNRLIAEHGIHDPETLEKWAEGHKNDTGELIPGYTIYTFNQLYKAYRNKYEINITVGDILTGIIPAFDKNFLETLKAKEYNFKSSQKFNPDKYLKYGYASVIILVIAFVIKILYGVFYGRPPA